MNDTVQQVDTVSDCDECIEFFDEILTFEPEPCEIDEIANDPDFLFESIDEMLIWENWWFEQPIVEPCTIIIDDERQAA